MLTRLCKGGLAPYHKTFRCPVDFVEPQSTLRISAKASHPCMRISLHTWVHIRPTTTDDNYWQCESWNERTKHETHCPICIDRADNKNNWVGRDCWGICTGQSLAQMKSGQIGRRRNGPMKMEQTGCSETLALKIMTRRITQNKEYKIHNRAKVWNEEYLTSALILFSCLFSILCILFLRMALCIVSPFVYICLFPIWVQV
jgi:hypothetical protein